MTYQRKMSFFVLIDIVLISISVISSYYLRFLGDITYPFFFQMMLYTAFFVTFGIISMYLFKLYQRIWQFASIQELLNIVQSIAISCGLAFLASSFVSGSRVPLSILLTSFETALFLTGGVRFAMRIWMSIKHKKSVQLPQLEVRVMIIGAGESARMIMHEMKLNPESGLNPVVFMDDDQKKHHMQIQGLPVVGGRDKIQSTVIQYAIDEIIIAMPSAPREELRKLIEICKETKAKLRIIPKIHDLISGKVTLNEMREVEIEDLLGRDSVKIDLHSIASYVEHKTVLVTGAGGSIGSELCRQLAKLQPSRLLLLGHGENSIYCIEMELLRLYPQLNYETIIADVQDQERMNQVFATYRPQVVFHAAAHKHVPLMERNPTEAIKNNVIGTRNVAEAADRYQVERFVLISTDKAVNPTSVMGATKRIAEMIIQGINEYSPTIYTAVRFGNVLGSNGSVIPRFKEQIRYGGPVTVTHPDMTRYFMTIPEAVQLVIQAGAYANGGELFILDMGKPVKIVDLAHDMIRLSGFEPYQDIDIVFTGIRPGEKLYEELLTDEEGIGSTLNNRIFVSKSMKIENKKLEIELKNLEKVIGEEQHLVRKMLNQIVPTYQEVS